MGGESRIAERVPQPNPNVVILRHSSFRDDERPDDSLQFDLESNLGTRTSLVYCLRHQANIVPSEAERIIQAGVDGSLASRIRDIVQVTVRV